MNSISSTYDLTSAASQLTGIHVASLRPDAHYPRPAPAFLHGPCGAEALRHFHNDQYEPPVLVYSAQGFEVVGPWFISGSLLVREGTTFSCPGISSNPDGAESRRRLEEHRSLTLAGKKTFRYVPGQVLLLAANGHQIYGHWLADFLPKLYLLELAGIDVDSVKILLPTNMGAFAAHLLHILGFAAENIVEYDPDLEAILPEELIIPTTLRWGGRCSPLFADAIAYLNERIDTYNRVPTAGTARRIFLSRAESGRTARPLLNEDSIERIAVQHGFHIVYPEKLPLLDQIGLFRAARRIVGQYGSALHGSIFSRAGSIVAGLHGQLPATFDALQSGMGERLGQPTGYVFGSAVPDHESPFAMSVAEDDFKACLDQNLLA